jgi:DNA-directed RNA polymerase specialized sigma24 family protein
VGRKRVERLMRRHSLSGLVKRRKRETTVRMRASRHPDLDGSARLGARQRRLRGVLRLAQLRSIAALGTRRRSALTLRAAGYSYRDIERLLGVNSTWVNRHITEARQALTRADAAAEAEVEAVVREAA